MLFHVESNSAGDVIMMVIIMLTYVNNAAECCLSVGNTDNDKYGDDNACVVMLLNAA